MLSKDELRKEHLRKESKGRNHKPQKIPWPENKSCRKKKQGEEEKAHMTLGKGKRPRTVRGEVWGRETSKKNHTKNPGNK